MPGPVPTAVNDPSAGAINVTSGGTLAIALLAADRDELGTTPDATATGGWCEGVLMEISGIFSISG